MLTTPIVHLVIMDLQMPDMNGVETTQHIRQHNSRVVIIGLTVSVSPIDHQHALESGMNQIYTKPLAVETLGQILVSITS